MLTMAPSATDMVDKDEAACCRDTVCPSLPNELSARTTDEMQLLQLAEDALQLCSPDGNRQDFLRARPPRPRPR